MRDIHSGLGGTVQIVKLALGQALKEPLLQVVRESFPTGDHPSERGTAFHSSSLEKDPKQRIRDIGDVSLALTGAFETTRTASAEPSAAPRLRLLQRPVPAVLVVLLVAVMTGVAGWMLRPSEPRAVTRFEYDIPANQQLVPLNREVLAVSPDGRRFVYNTNDGLYLRSLDTLEATLLPGTQDRARSPVFSPDGQSLAFHARDDQGGHLMRTDLGGGAPVLVADVPASVGDLIWAVDGTIFFGSNGDIMRVTATGGTPTLVVRAAEGELLVAGQLLPDGDTLLFTAGSAGTRDWDDAQIAVESLTSGDRTVLLPGRDAKYVSTGHLVYALDDGLFAVAFDADSLTVEGGSVSLLDGLAGVQGSESANFAISGDGTLFHLSGSGVASEPPVWVDRSGVVDVIDTVPPNAYSSLRLSPDGERVLVTADGDAWIYDLASGRESRVTSDGSVSPYYADWTPSGSEIAYSSSRAGPGDENIWIQPADGSGPARQLTALDGGVHFDGWAPDGMTFLAHHHPSGFLGTTRLLTIRPDQADAEPEAWLDRQAEDDGAVFSPDGRYVAYVSTESGQREIQVRPFPGPGGQQTVSVGGGEDLAWALSGELFYVRLDGYMMAAEVSTDPMLEIGQARELFRTTGLVGLSPRAQYTVTADGTRFLMAAASVATSGADADDASPKVVVTLNWADELKARVPTN